MVQSRGGVVPHLHGTLCASQLLCFLRAMTDVTTARKGTWGAHVGTLPELMRCIVIPDRPTLDSVCLTIVETVGCHPISTFPLLLLEHNTLLIQVAMSQWKAHLSSPPSHCVSLV